MGKQGKQWQIVFSWALGYSDCIHEVKSLMLFGRKVMTNLDSVLRSRDITLPTKVHLVKAMVFPVVIYGCESWTIRKAGHWGIDTFGEVSVGEDSSESLGLQGGKTSQSLRKSVLDFQILIGRSDAEAEVPILWPPDVKSWLIGKDPDTGKGWRQKERGQQGIRWLDGFSLACYGP